MRILVHLPPLLRARLRHAATSSTIWQTSSFERFFQEVQRAQWDFCLFDPELCSAEDARVVAGSKVPSFIPLVAYTYLSKTSAESLAGPFSDVVTAVILADFEDSPDRLRRALATTSSCRLGLRALNELEVANKTLTRGIRRGLFTTFAGAWPIECVKELIQITGLTRRSVDRSLRRVGLQTAHVLLMSANVLRAYTIMRQSQTSIRDAARFSGFGNSRALLHSCLSIIAADPRSLVALDEPTLMRALADKCVKKTV
jgi:AraC-like DNA-binding protein